jgi:hypothetical protein
MAVVCKSGTCTSTLGIHQIELDQAKEMNPFVTPSRKGQKPKRKQISL